jgi:tetratricopeptide (TPR) repeat protein
MPLKKIVSILVLACAALYLCTPALAGGKDDILAGNQAAMAGKFKTAVKHYTRAIALGQLNDKNLAVAYANRGSANDDLGRRQTAMADFAQAIKLDPGFAEAYYNRSFAYEKSGQIKKALADIKKALELTPGDKAYIQREYYLKTRLN